MPRVSSNKIRTSKVWTAAIAHLLKIENSLDSIPKIFESTNRFL
jgi:hypothetical protein